MGTEIQDARSQALIADILAARVDSALERLEGEARTRGYYLVINEILDPALRRIGALWASGEVSLAQGYVAGKVAELLFEKALKADSSSALQRGSIILGNIEDDFHALGRRMVAAFLRLHGWDVVDLGCDVEAASFVDEAERHEARIIGASAMMLSSARNIVGIREELDRRGLSGSMRLAVGGAIFRYRPDLVAEVGGDGTADFAMDAPGLFSRLSNRLAGAEAALNGAGAQAREQGLP